MDGSWVTFFLIVIIGVLLYSNHSSKNNTRESPRSKTSTKKKVIATVRFSYRDAVGDVTERSVDVRLGSRGQTFKGFCHLRREIREFRFDRIIDAEVIDINTGELMTADEWRKKLRRHYSDHS